MNKKKILLGLLSSTIIATAGESHHYVSLSAGSLDIDKTVYGEIENDNDDNIKLQAYDSISPVGLDYTFLKEVGESGFMIGVRPALILNEGEFFDGGLLNINLLAGPSFGNFKLYGNVGFGLHSLSEYSVSTGLNYGIVARYDITKHFSAAISYNIFDMEAVDPDETNPTRDYKLSGVLANLSLKF